MTTLQKAISELSGVVGVAARHLETGRSIGHNADEVFFTASTFKVPILAEMYRQVDEGTLDLSQRVELTDKLRVPGSGVLRELGNGISPTLHDLAMLMIIVSDNLATDIVYHTVGKESLNNTMQRLGLTKTKLPMSCRDLLFSLGGLPVSESMDDFWAVSDNVEQGYRNLSPDCDALNEEKSDVSSPNDMVRLLELVHNGDLLSESSREGFLHILKRQKLKSIIPPYLPKGTITAHKTGGIYSVRCDVGIVWGQKGPYAIAIMSKRITDSTDFDPKLARISKMVYDEMSA
jgi:beta-lactamase class A